MDSVYNKFYGGQSNNFGFKTWNPHSRQLTRSTSMPMMNSTIAKPLPNSMTHYKGIVNFNPNLSYSEKPIVNPDILKFQILENKWNNLEQAKYQQNEQLNSLMANQIMDQANQIMDQNQYLNQLPIIQNPPYYIMQQPPIQPYTYPNPPVVDINELIKDNQKHTKKKRRVIQEESSSESEEEYYHRNTKCNCQVDKGNDFMKSMKNHLALKLQDETYESMNNINVIQDSFKGLKSLLEQKLDQMDLKQKTEFANWRYALERGGTDKLRACFKNVFDGENNNIDEIEEKMVENKWRDWPDLIDKKISENEGRKKEMTVKKEKLKYEITKKVEEELKKQKLVNGLKKKVEIWPSITNIQPWELNNNKYLNQKNTGTSVDIDLLVKTKEQEIELESQLEKEKTLKAKLLMQQELRDKIIKNNEEKLNKKNKAWSQLPIEKKKEKIEEEEEEEIKTKEKRRPPTRKKKGTTKSKSKSKSKNKSKSKGKNTKKGQTTANSKDKSKKKKKKKNDEVNENENENDQAESTKNPKKKSKKKKREKSGKKKE
ncbi:MAG: hypothetical protein ACRC42_02370 [Mycoplasma sp.]